MTHPTPAHCPTRRPTGRSAANPVEGHANRIKMLKRTMFGRANFDLLRKRILLTT